MHLNVPWVAVGNVLGNPLTQSLFSFTELFEANMREDGLIVKTNVLFFLISREDVIFV